MIGYVSFGPDGPAITRVAEKVSAAMAGALERTLAELAGDDSVSPNALEIGILRSHLLGAAAVIASAHDGAPAREIKSVEIGDFVRGTAISMRATLP